MLVETSFVTTIFYTYQNCDIAEMVVDFRIAEKKMFRLNKAMLLDQKTNKVILALKFKYLIFVCCLHGYWLVVFENWF